MAVISDVHAFAQDAGRELGATGDPSWVRAAPDEADRRQAPFAALEELIQTDGLSADVLICPGDMGDKADRQGIAFTWGWLETVRRRLGAELVLATTGNHDVDSRDIEGRRDPTNAIQSLQPPYPLDLPALRDEYWRDHFTLVEADDFAIGLLNTCAGHSDAEAAERGRITDQTIEHIRRRLGPLQAEKRVLVCHHHPYRHDAIARSDYSEADGGPELIRVLEESGDWLIIHGHRHYPAIDYSGGTSTSPVILASGSFSAMLYPELTTRVRNQFSIVELEGVAPLPNTTGATGRVRSWEFNLSRGWVRPQSAEGIPDGSGFGCRIGAAAVASEIEGFVNGESAGGFVTLEDVVASRPHLAYLTPRDRESALVALGSRGLVSVAADNLFFTSSSAIFLRAASDGDGSA